ncbi:MAG TPA: VCBS repeat-containing protein, partial [Candidatus Acidoferrales bacterium]|nr:VCBS repeat-containing protein [Candidatus Acidoferrales bacterium]
MRCLLLAAAFPLLAAPPPATFVEHTIASDLRGGYQVVVADLNHDGKPDLIALASGMRELVWFENPGWQRHVLASGQNRMINCAVIGNEIVLASEFSNEAKNSIGLVTVLRPGSDPREPWTATEIDRLPTSHRLRFADIFGNGKPVVVNAALTAPDASGPDYRGQTPLVYYVPGEWKRRVISTENTGVVHGIFVTEDHCILTASFTGIHKFCIAKDGKVTRTELAKGDPAPWPKSGSSDVTIGHLGKTQFMAAIEPWHGNQVVVYGEHGREVIDDSLLDGHTIQTGDFDGDGNDEIVAGFRGQPRSVYVYRYDGKRWVRSDLDKGGMGAAACAIADLNGDRRPDVA